MKSRRHSHRIGGRAGVHLSHDLPAVRFHRDFAYALVVTHLLVHKAGYQQRRNLTLASKSET
jgi:hypothetical protein